MSLSDALAHYAWQLTVWQSVWGLSIIASAAVFLEIGRRLGRREAPGYWREQARRLFLRVWRERVERRSERSILEDRAHRAEADAARLRGAGERLERAERNYDEAIDNPVFLPVED